MKIRILIVSLCSLLTLPAAAYQVSPRLFLTPAQIERARKQATEEPRLEQNIAQLRTDLAKSLRDWRRILPARPEPYTMEEIFEAAKLAKTRPDAQVESAALALFPTPECAAVLREKLLYEIGIHKNEGSWRELAIHQGERLARFLQSYDLVARTDLFSAAEQQVIREELHQAARFLEPWCLGGSMSHVFQRQTFCFNIKYYPICMLGVVGLYFPEFEESKQWVEQADDLVLQLLLTENFIDGAYGENSIHYWAPTNHGLQLYLLANKNLGHRDYLAEPTFRNFYARFVRWRADLTATDGRKVAIGDGHRCGVGSEELLEAAYLLQDPELAWIAESIQQRVNGGYRLSPHVLLGFDAQFPRQKPAYTAANYIWSGYGIYRSGWEADDHFLMMKYGPTWAGRREVEQLPVIPGHSHQDCMEIELLYKGIPMLVDGGYRGVYRDYDTYGGFWKATIAHNTVGLGNDYGYSRTDGQFAEHVRKHGPEFRYEKEQINIHRNSSRLMAWSDVGGAVLLSARAETYKNVEHERTVVWFRDQSLTVVCDRLESDRPQRYELYFNAVGKRLPGAGYQFGDDKARLEVCPVGRDSARVQIVGKGTPNLPSYYFPFRPSFRGEPAWDGPNARWADYMLMVQSRHADTATFFNVLIPSSAADTYTLADDGAKVKKITTGDQRIYVAERVQTREMTVDGRFGVVRTQRKMPVEYALSNGYALSLDGRTLISSQLESTPWAASYDPKVTALVSTATCRATVVTEPNPWCESVMMYPPKLEAGKEPPVPIRVRVSFYTGKRPVRMIWERSLDKSPQLENPEYDRKIAQGNFLTQLKNYAVIDSRLTRRPQEFDYDAKTGMVTVSLPNGFNQLIWE